MLQTYFVKGLIGKVLAYGGLQIRKYIPHGLQIHADKKISCKREQSQACLYVMPSRDGGRLCPHGFVIPVNTTFFKRQLSTIYQQLNIDLRFRYRFR